MSAVDHAIPAWSFRAHLTKYLLQAKTKRRASSHQQFIAGTQASIHMSCDWHANVLPVYVINRPVHSLLSKAGITGQGGQSQASSRALLIMIHLISQILQH